MITLAEVLALDDSEEWLDLQPQKELEELVDRLADLGYAAGDADESFDDEGDYESREVLEEVRRYIAAGRLDDALLTIERFLHPKHSGAPWQPAA